MTNKTFLIIGASRGIGKALVLKLAEDSNNKVIALSRNEKALSTFCTAENIDFYGFDLASPTLKSDLDSILNSYKQIDYVVNNAGKLVNKPFMDLTDEDIRSCYDVNIISVMKATQCILPKMQENGGHILNISTMGGFQGSAKFAGLSAYSTSKAAVASFTELLAEEFKDTGVKSNCLCLGAVQTEMLAEAFPGYEAPVKPEEMAAFIADFLQQAHLFMNGKIIPVSLSTP